MPKKAVGLNPLDAANRTISQQVKAELAGVSSTWKDDLADRYTSLADDGQTSALKREASMMLAIAEGHLEEEEDYEEAVRTGTQALEAFRKIGDSEGVVDALRVVIDATHYVAALKDERDPEKEAQQIATDELAKFKESGDRRGQAAMLLSLAMLNVSTRGSKKRDEGIRQSKEALIACGELGDKIMEANTLLVLIRIYNLQRNRSEALSAASRALATFQEFGDKKGEARALHALGLARFDDEQYDGALQSFKGSLVTFTELGSKKMEAFVHNSMAQLMLAQDRPREALAEAKEALAIAQEVAQTKAWHTQFLGTTVDAYVMNKEPEAGVKLVRKSLVTFREAGETRREIEALDILARALLEERDLESALPRADEGVTLSREIGDKRLQVTLLHTVSRIQIERKEYTEALSCVKEMVPACMALDDPALEASAHHLAVTVHFQREKWTDALKAAKEAKELLTKAGNKHAEGRALLVMSTIHRSQQEEDQAVSTATEAQFLFQKERDKRWESRALFEVAEVQAFTGNFTAALRATKKAMALVQDLHDKQSQATLLSLLAIIQLSMFIDMCVANARKEPPQSEADEAMRAQEKALEFCQKNSEKKLAAQMHFGVAQVHLSCRRTIEAKSSITVAQQLCTALGDKEGEVVAKILTCYCEVIDQNNKQADEVAEDALATAKKNGDERGEYLANNIKAVIDEMKKAAADSSGGGEAEVDPEMLKLKIQDVANSLMGIESLAGDTPLMDAGLDSLSMVEFRNELVKEFPGVDLPGALLFDYPTVNALTDFVGEGIKRSGKALK